MDRSAGLFKMFGRFFPQGAIIYKENDPGDEVFIVQSGSIRLKSRGEEISAQRTIGQGGIVGEDALRGEAHRREMAEALEDSRLLAISAASLEGLVRNGPEFAHELMILLGSRLSGAVRDLRKWQGGHVFRKIEPLLRKAEAAPLPPEEISRLSGVELSAVLSVVEHLERKGALARESGGFRTIRPAGLDDFDKGGSQ